MESTCINSTQKNSGPVQSVKQHPLMQAGLYKYAVLLGMHGNSRQQTVTGGQEHHTTEVATIDQ